MAHSLYKLKERIRYRFSIRHDKGHGIHSPYLYRFVSCIIQEKYPYYCFDQIESLGREMLYNPESDCKGFNINRYQFSEDTLCGQIIFRIIQDAQFKILLELGSTAGMETQYMAFANPKARCICETKSDELAALAQKGFQKQGLSRIEQKIKETPAKILESLENLDFVLFNKLSGPEELLDLFKQCLRKKNKDSIFVIRDIHESPAMTKIWKNICTNENVIVSIDLFSLGIVLFNPEQIKKNYVLRAK